MPDITELENLIQRFPDKPFPRYGLAMEYKKAGRFADAVAQFQKALELDPNYVAAYMHCGIAMRDAGNPVDAKATWQKGLAVAQKIGNAHAAGEISGLLMEIG